MKGKKASSIMPALASRRKIKGRDVCGVPAVAIIDDTIV